MFWERKMNEEEGNDCFNKLQEFMTSNEVDMSSDIKSIFQDHLLHLNNWFEKYFKNENIDRFTWIQDPFNAYAPFDFTSAEEENLIELSCDNSLKAKFGRMELTEFWISTKMNIHFYAKKLKGF